MSGIDIDILLVGAGEATATTVCALRRTGLANGVHIVPSRQEALEVLFGALGSERRRRPRLILLEMTSADEDGNRFATTIANDPRTRPVPLVVLTPSRTERHRIERNCLPANSYVVKPADFEQLVEVVRTLAVYWLFVHEPAPDADVRLASGDRHDRRDPNSPAL